MPRSLLIILFCLTLTACASFRTAQNTPVGQQNAILATQGIAGQDSGNDDNLSHETPLPAALQKTPTPDLTQKAQDAMMIAAMALTKQIQDADFQQRTETKGVSLTQVLYVAQTAKAKPAADTATVSAKSTADALAIAKITEQAYSDDKTQQAPADLATAQHLAEYAKSEPIRAWTGPILDIGGGIGLAAFGLAMLLFVAMKWHWYNTAQTESETPIQPQWVQTAPNTIARRGSSADPDPHVSDIILLRYIEYALRGSMLGINNAAPALKGVIEKSDVEYMTDYFRDNGYMSPVALERGGTANIINQAGREWCADQMLRIGQPPAPDASIAETDAPTQHERAETSVLDGGAVIQDNFSAEITGYVVKNVLLTNDKDGDK